MRQASSGSTEMAFNDYFKNSQKINIDQSWWICGTACYAYPGVDSLKCTMEQVCCPCILHVDLPVGLDWPLGGIRWWIRESFGLIQQDCSFHKGTWFAGAIFNSKAPHFLISQMRQWWELKQAEMTTRGEMRNSEGRGCVLLPPKYIWKEEGQLKIYISRTTQTI